MSRLDEVVRALGDQSELRGWSPFVGLQIEYRCWNERPSATFG